MTRRFIVLRDSRGNHHELDVTVDEHPTAEWAKNHFDEGVRILRARGVRGEFQMAGMWAPRAGQER